MHNTFRAAIPLALVVGLLAGVLATAGDGPGTAATTPACAAAAPHPHATAAMTAKPLHHYHPVY